MTHWEGLPYTFVSDLSANHSKLSVTQFPFVWFFHVVINRVNLAIELCQVTIIQHHIKPTFANTFLVL